MRTILLRVCVLLLATLSVAICLFAFWFHLAMWGAIVLLLITVWTVRLSFRPTHPQWLALGAGLMFTCALGGVYPRLGINALPEGLAAQLGSVPVTQFNPPQPSLLSMRLRRSVQAFAPIPDSKPSPAPLTLPQVVFVEGPHRDEFLSNLQQRNLRSEQKGRLRTFYSRRAWVRFARPDARWEDWKAALRDRSLEGLKSEFYYYLVSAAPAK